MSSSFTPGPWLLEMPPAGEWSSRWAYVRAEHWGVVTSVQLDNSLPHWDGPQRANARLIAAAPELLLVAQMCLFALNGGTGHADTETRRKHLQDAIRKATGEQP